MAFTPGCDYDLFISYASVNNRGKWVTSLHQVLTAELEELLGPPFSEGSVYFDEVEVQVGSISTQLKRAAEASAVLMPILSPHYLASHWCNQERNAFLTRIPNGALEADFLAPVLVRPIDGKPLPQSFRDAHMVSFLLPGKQVPCKVKSRDWNERLNSLAAQLKRALEELRQRCRLAILGHPVPGTQSEHAICREGLHKRHFRVGPEVLLVFEDEAALTQELRHAALSVHFIGSAEDSSLLAIERSVEICPGPTIVCQPPGVRLSEEERIWLTELERRLTPVLRERFQRVESTDMVLAIVDGFLAEV